MPSDRRTEIGIALYENAAVHSLGKRITTLATELLNADHCSLVLSMGYDITTITGGTSLTSVMDERQMVLGDGPTVSAIRDSTPMILADTDGVMERERWPLFCDEAATAGVRGVLSFPIFTGAIRLGALTAYWTTPHSPTPSEYSDGSLLADVALEAILNDLAGVSLDTALSELGQDVQHHMLIQQAVGMVSEQLSVPILEAMVRIRSTAYSSHRQLIDVAKAIIARQETLEK
jgi:transcriptional regulator with GAF, ATPase, and Fis domain